MKEYLKRKAADLQNALGRRARIAGEYIAESAKLFRRRFMDGGWSAAIFVLLFALSLALLGGLSRAVYLFVGLFVNKDEAAAPAPAEPLPPPEPSIFERIPFGVWMTIAFLALGLAIYAFLKWRKEEKTAVKTVVERKEFKIEKKKSVEEFRSLPFLLTPFYWLGFIYLLPLLRWVSRDILTLRWPDGPYTPEEWSWIFFWLMTGLILVWNAFAVFMFPKKYTRPVVGTVAWLIFGFGVLSAIVIVTQVTYTVAKTDFGILATLWPTLGEWWGVLSRGVFA